MEAEQKFLKGFNAGYLLAKHNSQLAYMLKKGMQENENPLVQGFIEGTIEFGLEKSRANMNQHSQNRKLFDRDR